MPPESVFRWMQLQELPIVDETFDDSLATHHGSPAFRIEAIPKILPAQCADLPGEEPKVGVDILQPGDDLIGNIVTLSRAEEVDLMLCGLRVAFVVVAIDIVAATGDKLLHEWHEGGHLLGGIPELIGDESSSRGSYSVESPYRRARRSA